MEEIAEHIIFTTERLIVRQYTERDKDNFFSLSGNEMVMQYIRPVSNREKSDKFLSEYIAAYKEDPCSGRWAVIEKESGDFVGSFAIIPMPSQSEKMQLGYSLTERHWGRGFATELTRAGLIYFFETHQHNEICGITEIPNSVSQKVLMKAGFKPAGSFMEDGKELLMFIYKK